VLRRMSARCSTLGFLRQVVLRLIELRHRRFFDFSS
jgi:hypothetical protein